MPGERRTKIAATAAVRGEGWANKVTPFHSLEFNTHDKHCVMTENTNTDTDDY